MGAFIPGLLAAIGYIIVIAIYVRVRPGAGATLERVPYVERIKALFDIWPVLAVFVLVIGWIYTGIFPPTEAVAIGAAGTGLIALANRSLCSAGIRDALISTAMSTAMIFLIVFGAVVL